MFKSLLARAREARASELDVEGASETGFTLIELMVVLLIIAILLAIAIPTFLGVTGSAKDRSAQSQLTNLLTEVTATYQNTQAFPSSTTSLTSYSSGDPQFTWNDGNATTPTNCSTANTKCVSVANVDVASATDAQGVVLAVMSTTGTCWYAVNLQAQPVTTTAFGTETTGYVQFPLPSAGAQTPGTFYAKSTATGGGHTAKACNAGAAASGFTWANNYGAAPNN